jgi:roadblock/LC7 domain-containing protein
MITDGIQTIQSGSVSQAQLTTNGLQLQNVEKAWIYSADGKLVKYLKGNPQHVSVDGLLSGTYIVKMQNKGVTRSTKFVK